MCSDYTHGISSTVGMENLKDVSQNKNKILKSCIKKVVAKKQTRFLNFRNRVRTFHKHLFLDVFKMHWIFTVYLNTCNAHMLLIFKWSSFEHGEGLSNMLILFDRPNFSYTHYERWQIFIARFFYSHRERWRILIGWIYFTWVMKSGEFWLANIFLHTSWRVVNFDWPIFSFAHYERWQIFIGRIIFTCITKGGEFWLDEFILHAEWRVVNVDWTNFSSGGSIPQLKIQRKYGNFDFHQEGVCRN